MRDVDYRLRFQKFRQWRHQKGAAWLAKDVYDFCQFGLAGIGQGTEYSEGRWAANSSCIGPLVGQRLKHPFADLFLVVASQLTISLLGMLIQRMGHGSDSFIMR
jgi:hypothetical protein